MLTDCMSSQIAEVPDDEAVRIFLEFERVESAIKGQQVYKQLDSADI